MGYVNDLIMFFTIYSFLGWSLETAFASIKQRKFINRGFLTGFVCPIYGFGAVFIIQLSKLVTNIFDSQFTSLIINILFSIIVVTVLEYITGLLLEKIFHCKWWDYSDNAFNLQGYICLSYSLLWGFLSFLLIQFVHPIIAHAVISIPIYYKPYLGVLICIYFILDISKSVFEMLDLRRVILNHAAIPLNKYYEKIIRYERLFLAFPRLLLLNADIINHDIRSILNDKMDKIKVKVKSRFH